MKIKNLFTFLSVLGLLFGAIAAPSAGSAMPAVGSISGTTTYSGSYDTNHEVLVSAHLNPISEPVQSVHIMGPGAYSLDVLPDGSYYISAFLDIHDRGEGPPEFGEPVGWYDSNADGSPDPVTVSGGDISGIDIEIKDIDSEYIQGTACYLGGLYGPGQLEVALHTNPGAPPVVAQYVSRPCDEYIFSGGPSGTYYASLFYDVNASGGPPDPGEPVGWYDPNGDGNPDPIVYSGDVITDVNITVGRIHYVDFSAGGNQDGASWDNAFRDPQDALAAAQPGEEIWVASGIYTPGATRDASFVLRHGVALYGGFSGTESYRYQRNWRANATVLSGEIGDPGLKTDNAYHVVTTASTYLNPVDETTILDGFTITGGYADIEAGQTEKGGGFLNNYGNPTLVNLNFIDNYALNHGGAIATQFNSKPLVIANTTISGNSAVNNAGGIANFAKLMVINSSIVGNTGANGGGIVNLFDSRTEIYNTILWANQGAEVALQGTSVVTVSYSIIDGGFAGGSNILSADPLFVDADGADDAYGTLDDDLHLSPDSPAIDAGDNARLASDAGDTNGNGNISESLPVDMDGDSRLIDDSTVADTGNGASPLVDIGADEAAPAVAIAGLQIASADSFRLGDAALFAARTMAGTQVAYAWDFGDGNTGSGPLQAHAYPLPGVYPVVLTATNSLGSLNAAVEITVYESLSLDPGEAMTTTDGALTFDVPASITDTVTISYTPQITPTGAPGGYEFAGLAFELLATDGDGYPILEPQMPFTVTLHYNQGDLPSGTDEATLELNRYDQATGAWVALQVLSRDLANNTLTVLLDHFSEFAIFIQPAKTENLIYLPMLQR